MSGSLGLDTLLQTLKPEAELGALGEREWDLVVRLARAGDLLARIGHRAAAHQASVPSRVAVHLQSASLLAERQHRELALELRVIDQVFVEAGIPVVVLKGAAYVLAGLDAAGGRMVSDIDLMVPPELLPQAESALMMAGWISANRDAYDQRYYRTWMHEIPPMRHISRGTVIDLHHNILPPTGRIKLDAGRLMEAALPLPSFAGLRVLAPVDMLLHSAAHLTHEGELDTGLRGVVDLDALVREFSQEGSYFDRLLHRAVELNLGRPLFQALRLTRHVMSTPLPSGWLEQLAQASGFHAQATRQALLERCWEAAVLPRHPLLTNRLAPVARSVLYLRGHWLRMPPGLLLRHLSRKAIRAVFVAGADREKT